ncbi:UNVERIFIED_CONTAM: hypothetical protein PYX00_001362 [Menopon gallinae]|uniref:Secreted protein n=1 Tax=Menopon gallinae TaxID=328185 RepID=A0AAW2ICG9_9NEOP
MFMMRDLLLFASFVFVVAQEQQTSKCSCAVFGSRESNTTTGTPVVMKKPNFPIKCDSTGKTTCAKMCIALAEAARDQAPKVLCRSLVDNTEPFTPQVYSKTCDEKVWTNTGVKSTLQLCCAAKLPIPCETESNPEK